MRRSRRKSPCTHASRLKTHYQGTGQSLSAHEKRNLGFREDGHQEHKRDEQQPQNGNNMGHLAAVLLGSSSSQVTQVCCFLDRPSTKAFLILEGGLLIVLCESASLDSRNISRHCAKHKYLQEVPREQARHQASQSARVQCASQCSLAADTHLWFIGLRKVLHQLRERGDDHHHWEARTVLTRTKKKPLLFAGPCRAEVTTQSPEENVHGDW